MKTLLSVVIALTGLALAVDDADARRFGGGRSIGTQRSITQQQAAPKAPARQQQPQQAATTTPAQQPAGASKWLGPLAGLALGAGLFALFLNNGWAGVLAGLLMIALIIAAVMFVARSLRGRTAQQPLQYAGAGGTGPSFTTLPGSAGAHSVAATAGRWPAGFDADEFVRHARRNFVRMQEAHDRKELSMLRDFLTPDLYREIESDIRAMGDAPQKTEVVTLDAEVLDVAIERNLYVVSVRFSGLIRERADDEAGPFSEIWHLEKPVSGRSGWMISGIQQA